ncbi:unnamed protein product [Amoebophrya sp. A120]|nr:unnamed protein product [Amoebophrya sp. A120]|eukprot:GSA120T00001811001.1
MTSSASVLEEVQPLIALIDHHLNPSEDRYYHGTLGSQAFGSSVHYIATLSRGASVGLNLYLGNLEAAVDLEFLRSHRVRGVINCCPSAGCKEIAAETLSQLDQNLQSAENGIHLQKFYDENLGRNSKMTGPKSAADATNEREGEATPVRYLEVPCEDHVDYDIARHFEECCAFVESLLATLESETSSLASTVLAKNSSIPNSSVPKKESKAEARARKRMEKACLPAGANTNPDIGAAGSTLPGLLVHCAMGVNRSAAITAAILIRQTKCNSTKAVEKIAKARGVGILSNRNFLKAIKDFSVQEMQKGTTAPGK